MMADPWLTYHAQINHFMLDPAAVGIERFSEFLAIQFMIDGDMDAYDVAGGCLVMVMCEQEPDALEALG